jgi:hypothetical protein
MSSGIAPLNQKDISSLETFLATKPGGTDVRLSQLIRSALNSRIKSLGNTSVASREKRKRLGVWGLGEMPIPEATQTLIRDRIKKGQSGKGRWKNLQSARPEDFMITLTRKNRKTKPAPFTMSYLVDNGMDMDAYYREEPRKRMSFLWSSFYNTPNGQTYVKGKQAKFEKMARGLAPKGGLSVKDLGKMTDADITKAISAMS